MEWNLVPEDSAAAVAPNALWQGGYCWVELLFLSMCAANAFYLRILEQRTAYIIPNSWFCDEVAIWSDSTVTMI